ncbi:hypothetical protein N9137_01565 [Pseudomonadales bacterium]|nr:hypothetical protein [Pseudomonadales bacterium]
MFNKIALVMATLMAAYTTPALANWGDNWGEMAWGAPTAANVPMMGGLGMALLALALVAMAVKGLRSHSTLGLLLLVGVVGAVNNVEAQVTIPNTFSDGTPALASEVNANFQALASAVNASDCATAADVVCNPALSCPAAPACDTLGSYNLGFTDGGNGVDITSDNAAVCTTAGGTYDAGADSCSVDITTDNAAVCTTAGGTYDAGTDSCSVDITTDNAAAEAVAAAAAGSAACTQAGGTWDAGTSTCTPAAASYNCFIGGFCSQAAIDFPPASYGYTNVYDGHTQTTEPALGAGCNNIQVANDFGVGRADVILERLPIVSLLNRNICASN